MVCQNRNVLRKACRSLSLIALTGSFFAYAESPSVWKKDGYGNWAAASRWVDGNVPGAGYQVRVSNGQMTAGDVDKAILEAISEIVVSGASSSLDITNNAAMNLSFKFWGEGVVRKYGTGKMTVDIGSDANFVYCNRGFEVHDGELAFTGYNGVAQSGYAQKIRGPLAVYAPGSISLLEVGNTLVQGIIGDGTIRQNGSAVRELCVSNSAARGVYDFSGNLVGDNLHFFISGGNQQLTGTANANNQSGRIRGGRLGVACFGSDGGVSSWGAGELVFIGQGDGSMPCEVEYLGGGESSSRKIYVNSYSRHVAFAGGSAGGLELLGRITFTVARMTELVLSGDHVSPCSIDCEISNSQSGFATYIKKDGTGTWRFKASAGRNMRQNHGVVETSRGVTEYETIANAGEECSLGDATILHEDYTGPRDNSREVSYAYLIGDGSAAVSADTATMRYVGTAAADVTNRPVAVKGAGRFESSVAQLDWTGFSGLSEGSSSLVLGGAVQECWARSVTDGFGSLSVVKEGAGSWNLGGDLDFSGRIDVKCGDLKIQNSPSYAWYRLEIRKLYDDSKAEAMLGRVALFDENGTDLAAGVTYDSTCDANPDALPPGRACLATSGLKTNSTNPIGNLFVAPYDQSRSGRWSRNPAVSFSRDDSNTWAAIAIRLPKGAGPVVRYDMISAWYTTSGAPFAQTPTEWVLSGSFDGRKWVELDVHSRETAVTNGISGGCYWLSDRTPAAGTPTGFAIASGVPGQRKLSSVAGVSVAGASRLETDATVEIGSLSYDATAGAGKIVGFSFAETGVFSYDGYSHDAPKTIAYEFEDCTGLENLSGWTVKLNGREKPGLRLSATESGITIIPLGCVIIFR